jgi:hypothetical protein
MQIPHSLRVSFLLFAVVLVAAVGCRKSEPAAAAPSAGDPPPFVANGTIKDLMLNVVDRQADVVWQSVTTVASDKGLVETKPKNDEEWAAVKAGAVTLAEAANLLMIPGRRVARPGEKSETPGIELEPSEMEELIKKDPHAFYMRTRALYDAAMLAAEAADHKDAEKVFEIGENIERACENCHRQYWYPNEKIPDLPAAQ